MQKKLQNNKNNLNPFILIALPNETPLITNEIFLLYLKL